MAALIAANLVMVGSAGLCVGGAVRSRNPLAVSAALVMFVAMADHALLGVVSPVWWSLLLVAGGLMVGSTLRASALSFAESSTESSRSTTPTLGNGCAVVRGTTSSDLALTRAIGVSATLAYFAMAWLLLGHQHPAGGGVTSTATHAGHGGGAHLVGMLLDGAALVLVVLLAVLMARAVRQKRTALASEAGGMAAMIAAMFLAMILPN